MASGTSSDSTVCPHTLNASVRLSRLAAAVFCDQHYPKTRLPGHHLRVRSRRFLEWDGLDHCSHPPQRTESERCITSRRIPRQPPSSLPLSEYAFAALHTNRL